MGHVMYQLVHEMRFCYKIQYLLSNEKVSIIV